MAKFPSYFEERGGGDPVPDQISKTQKTKYHRLRGWDESKGWPTLKKLHQLGLADIAEDLVKRTHLESA